MLILGRRSQQSIYINGEIKISILKIEGNSVRVGIEAPKHITVHREEVFQRIQSEKLKLTHANEARTSLEDDFVEVA